VASQKLTGSDEFSTSSDADRKYVRKKSREGKASQIVHAGERVRDVLLLRVKRFKKTREFATVKNRDSTI
jgi:hypothetical protein